jgi:hypothetical protein
MPALPQAKDLKALQLFNHKFEGKTIRGKTIKSFLIVLPPNGFALAFSFLPAVPE